MSRSPLGRRLPGSQLRASVPLPMWLVTRTARECTTLRVTDHRALAVTGLPSSPTAKVLVAGWRERLFARILLFFASPRDRVRTTKNGRAGIGYAPTLVPTS